MAPQAQSKLSLKLTCVDQNRRGARHGSLRPGLGGTYSVAAAAAPAVLVPGLIRGVWRLILGRCTAHKAAQESSGHSSAPSRSAGLGIRNEIRLFSRGLAPHRTHHTPLNKSRREFLSFKITRARWTVKSSRTLCTFSSSLVPATNIVKPAPFEALRAF